MTNKKEKELADEIGDKLNDITRSLEQAEQELNNDAHTLRDGLEVFNNMTAWSAVKDYDDDDDWDTDKMERAQELLRNLENTPSEVKGAIDEIDDLIGLYTDLLDIYTVHLNSPLVPHNTLCGRLKTGDDIKSQHAHDEKITCKGCKEAWLKIKAMMEK